MGVEERSVQPGKPPRGRNRCSAWGAHLGYLPEEGNEARRRDRNPAHRAYRLKRHDGDLTCLLCGARRSERHRVAFNINHLVPLEDGGPDEEWNTGPTCRHATRSRRAAGAAPARRRPFGPRRGRRLVVLPLEAAVDLPAILGDI